MARILLILEYDGAPYVGWQRQGMLPSVQAALEGALATVTGEAIAQLCVQCAGRTDAGVHARGQRITFQTQSVREPRRFVPALNHVLPQSVRVHRAEAVGDGFDVRRSASGKWYRYEAYFGPHRSALLAQRAWHVRKELDVARLRACLPVLLGEHDFEAFRSVHCDAPHAHRRLHVLEATWRAMPPIGQVLLFDVVGNAFCRHMVRILAGTAIDVGTGALPADATHRALAARRREAAGQTAPAHGLTLMDVAYGRPAGAWPPGWPQSGGGNRSA